MKTNVANKTDKEINTIIETFNTTEQANIMGFEFLLPLLDENNEVLTLKGCGVYVEPTKAPTAPSDFMKRSDREINYLNSLPA